MKLQKLLLSVILLQLTAFSMMAQQKEPKKFETQYLVTQYERDLFADAEHWFQEHEYDGALPLFWRLERDYPGEPLYTYRLGQCYLLKTSADENKAFEFLLKTDRDQAFAYDLDFYLAKAYEFAFEFDKAIALYKKFIKDEPEDAKVAEANALIKNCENAKDIVQNPTNVRIYNLGNTINTIYSEYAPILMKDNKTLMFTFRGDSMALKKNRGDQANLPIKPLVDYYEEVFSSTMDAPEHWTIPFSMKPPFNVGKHNCSGLIFGGGNKVFIENNFRHNANGDLYFSVFENGKWQDAKELLGINSEFWEGSPTMSSDEKMIIFSSERPGGLGGKDLWKSSKQADGSWSVPVNLGPSVNTVLNDNSPFLTYDQTYLYFASEGHSSIGGYDVFRAKVKGDGGFEKPENLGYPINSIDNDINFSTSMDGSVAYYSSAKPGGYGFNDLYKLETKNVNLNLKTFIINLSGTVTSDKKPIQAKVTVFFDDGTTYGMYTTNMFDGKYTAREIGGNKYKIIFEAPGYLTKTEILDVTNVTQTTDKVIDADLQPIPAAIAKLDSLRQGLATIKKCLLHGTVLDKDTRAAIADAKVKIRKLPLIENQKDLEVSTNKQGKFMAELDPNAEYEIVAFKDFLQSKTFTISTTQESKTEVEVALTIPGDEVTLRFDLSGTVLDNVTQKAISGANVTVTRKSDTKSFTQISDENGKFMFDLQPNENYELLAVSSGQSSKTEILSTQNRTKSESFKLTLLIGAPMVTTQKEVAEILVKRIYFDYDQSNIEQQYETHLKVIIDLMKANKNFKLEVTGHTDGNGNDEYNMALSMRRAMSASAFLMRKGVSQNRIKTISKGETELLDKNESINGADNPEARRKNRRVEFRIYTDSGELPNIKYE